YRSIGSADCRNAAVANAGYAPGWRRAVASLADRGIDLAHINSTRLEAIQLDLTGSSVLEFCHVATSYSPDVRRRGNLCFWRHGSVAGRLCGAACDHGLHWLERSIAWGRDLPGSYLWLAAPPTWWIGLFYVALAIAVVFPALRPKRQWIMALG